MEFSAAMAQQLINDYMRADVDDGIEVDLSQVTRCELDPNLEPADAPADTLCAICLEEQLPPTHRTACSHWFHPACLTRALDRSDACPVCREPLPVTCQLTFAHNYAPGGVPARVPRYLVPDEESSEEEDGDGDGEDGPGGQSGAGGQSGQSASAGPRSAFYSRSSRPSRQSQSARPPPGWAADYDDDDEGEWGPEPERLAIYSYGNATVTINVNMSHPGDAEVSETD